MKNAGMMGWFMAPTHLILNQCSTCCGGIPEVTSTNFLSMYSVDMGSFTDETAVAVPKTNRNRNFKSVPSLEELYSTVTLFARFRGWSTSVPLATAV